MREHHGILAHIPFIGRGKKENGAAKKMQSVRQRRSFLLRVVSDVESRVFSKQVDVRKNETLLHNIQEEHDEIIPKRDIALKRYREVDGVLSSLLEKIDGLKGQKSQFTDRLGRAQKKKRELSVRLPDLADETTLENELRDLKVRFSEKEKERTASALLVGELETDNETLSILKTELVKSHQQVIKKKEIALEKREALENRKIKQESTLKKIEQLTKELDQEDTALNELLGSESNLKTKDQSLSDEVKSLNEQEQGVSGQLIHYRQEEKTLKEENRETLETVEKIKGIKEALQVALSEKEDKFKNLKDIQERLTLVGGEEGSLEEKLKDIQEETSSFSNKKSALEDRAKPILDALESLSKREEEAEKEKEQLEESNKNILSTKEAIRVKELEIRSFKDALEEIMTHV